MIFSQENHNSIFQVEGIGLITLAPNIIVLPIPGNYVNSNSNTFVEFDVYLINNTLNSFRVQPNETLIPKLLQSDGQVLQGQIVVDVDINTEQSNIPIQSGFAFKVKQLWSNFARWFFPRKTREFDPRLIDSSQARLATVTLMLLQQNNLLKLQVIDRYSFLQNFFSLLDKYWIFSGLQIGDYQLRFLWGILFENSESGSDSKTTQEISTEQLATKILNLRLIEPIGAKKSAVEVDGIRFETLMPEQVLTLPEKKRGVNTRMQLGICITNNTLSPVRLNFFATLIPQLVGADGQVCLRSYFRRGTKRPLASDCPLVMPGENAIYSPYCLLYWRKCDQFVLNISAGDGGYWSFDTLKVGIYKIHILYNNIYVNQEISNQESMNNNLIEGLFTGMISTPFIEFCLVNA